MENVLKGKHVGFSHFREEYIEHIAKQQWDNASAFELGCFTSVGLKNGKISQLIKKMIDFFAILENTTEEFIGWVSLSDVQLKIEVIGIAILQKSNVVKDMALRRCL